MALNTANDDTTVVKDFASGQTTVAFVDNASDVPQLAALLGKSYAYIPVGAERHRRELPRRRVEPGAELPDQPVQADAEHGGRAAYLALPVAGRTTSPPPRPKFELSDNLMAALAAADPPVTCAVLSGCPSTKGNAKQVAYETKYNAFALLNPVPDGDYVPQTFGSFNSNVASGSAYQATQKWVCNAPNTPYQVQVDENGQTAPVPVTVTDTNVGSSTLTTAPIGSSIWPPYPGATWIFPQCQGYSTLPRCRPPPPTSVRTRSRRSRPRPCGRGATAAGCCPYLQPAEPVRGVRPHGHVRGPLPRPVDGLAGERRRAVRGRPDVQPGGRGQGVHPCPDADLSCPAGTYTTDYADTDPPLPAHQPHLRRRADVDLPYDEGTAVKTLLTNLVTYSHSSAVPAGYAPLPDGIEQAALATSRRTCRSPRRPPPPRRPRRPSPPAARPEPPGRRTRRGPAPTRRPPTTGPGSSVAAPVDVRGRSGSSGSGPGSSGSTPVAAPPAPSPRASWP